MSKKDKVLTFMKTHRRVSLVLALVIIGILFPPLVEPFYQSFQDAYPGLQPGSDEEVPVEIYIIYLVISSALLVGVFAFFIIAFLFGYWYKEYEIKRKEKKEPAVTSLETGPVEESIQEEV